MSSIATSTVFSAKTERTRGTVQLQVTTDHGIGHLRLTPALAKQLGRELVLAADKPDAASAPIVTPHAQPGGRAPVLKPSGRID